MHVDALVCIMAAALVLATRSRASAVVLAQNVFIFGLVYGYWVNSGFWHLEFLPDFHLSLALVNTFFLGAAYATRRPYHLLKLASAMLVILNLAVFFYIEIMNGSSGGLVVVYPFIRLLLIAAQFVGAIQDADRNTRKRRKLRSRGFSVNHRSFRHQLSFAQVPKRDHTW